MDHSIKQDKISLTEKIRAYLELMRPANIITAFADILAGFAAAGGTLYFKQTIPILSPSGIGWLLLSTFGLYGGGVVFNDVFDARIDTEERPERAIPSGRATKTGAILLGSLLFFSGICAAFLVGTVCGIIAISIAFCALLYDSWAKSSSVLGPFVMGLCRGGNFLLGCSIFPFLLSQLWYLAIIPVVYISSITLISQGEVHGGSKKSGLIALSLIIGIVCCLFLLGLIPAYKVLLALPFIVLFSYAVIPSFAKAAFNSEPAFQKKAVKRGVISLIILNSAVAAGFGGLILGILILSLLPLTKGLAKLFSVT